VKSNAAIAAEVAKLGRLITPKVGQAITGLHDRSQFWDVIHENRIPVVRYTARCIRIAEAPLLALIAAKTVAAKEDLARLADGRRRP
jgi:hypothetical protein